MAQILFTPLTKFTIDMGKILTVCIVDLFV